MNNFGIIYLLLFKSLAERILIHLYQAMWSRQPDMYSMYKRSLSKDHIYASEASLGIFFVSLSVSWSSGGSRKKLHDSISPNWVVFLLLKINIS